MHVRSACTAGIASYMHAWMYGFIALQCTARGDVTPRAGPPVAARSRPLVTAERSGMAL